jgi:predicted DNA-binding protein
MNATTFHMVTSPDLKERLRVLARADGRTLAGYINKVLADHVAKKEGNREAEK